MTQVFKPSLENANLLLLEVLIRRVLEAKGSVHVDEAITDLDNFMHNRTSSATVHINEEN